MSGKQFFTNRYSKLGWEYEDIELKKAIRINSANTRNTELVARLASRGVKLEKIPFLEDGYRVCESEFSLGATTEYLLGLYSIQEAAAQIPATLFSELKDKTVLDACSAPGGKTVQLADLMRNTGAIIALDTDRRRLTALSNQLERCHVSNTIVYHMDARQASETKIMFDRILLDVPCSGNFAADKAWFGRRALRDVQKNAQVQRQILTQAVQVLKDDGEMVYSTCSLEPEEDELNVDWAIENLNLRTEWINCHGEKALTEIFGKRLDKSIENCRRIWPGQTQGFFICKLKKKGHA
jgi:NOL1/NOP2/sun family putative RNA methylase